MKSAAPSTFPQISILQRILSRGVSGCRYLASGVCEQAYPVSFSLRQRIAIYFFPGVFFH